MALQDGARRRRRRRDIFGPPAAGTDVWKKLIGGLYTPAHKPSAAEVEATGVSEYMEDLVQLCKAAHRAGVGNLVWLSWDGFNEKGRRCRVCHAATLIAPNTIMVRKHLVRHSVEPVATAEHSGEDTSSYMGSHAQ